MRASWSGPLGRGRRRLQRPRAPPGASASLRSPPCPIAAALSCQDCPIRTLHFTPVLAHLSSSLGRDVCASMALADPGPKTSERESRPPQPLRSPISSIRVKPLSAWWLRDLGLRLDSCLRSPRWQSNSRSAVCLHDALEATGPLSTSGLGLGPSPPGRPPPSRGLSARHR